MEAPDNKPQRFMDVLNSRLDKVSKAESVPKPEVLQTETEVVNTEVEQERQMRLDDVRQRLVSLDEGSNDGDVAKVKAALETEEMQEFSRLFKKLASSVDDLSSTITRNKFPKVGFNSEEIKMSVSGEDLKPNAIREQLQELRNSIRRITMPEDRMQWLSFEPHNFRAVLEDIDKVGRDLGSLRIFLGKSNKSELASLSPDVVDTIKRLKMKKDSFEELLIKLSRYKNR